MGSELGSEASWRAESASLEVETAPGAGPFCSHPFLAGRRFGCTVLPKPPRLSEQVTEEAIEGWGGDGEGRGELKGHMERWGKSGGDSLTRFSVEVR